MMAIPLILNGLLWLGFAAYLLFVAKPEEPVSVGKRRLRQAVLTLAVMAGAGSLILASLGGRGRIPPATTIERVDVRPGKNPTIVYSFRKTGLKGTYVVEGGKSNIKCSYAVEKTADLTKLKWKAIDKVSFGKNLSISTDLPVTRIIDFSKAIPDTATYVLFEGDFSVNPPGFKPGSYPSTHKTIVRIN